MNFKVSKLHANVATNGYSSPIRPSNTRWVFLFFFLKSEQKVFMGNPKVYIVSHDQKISS